MDFFLAHSQRHHASHLFLGAQKVSAEALFVVPYYPKGLGKIISLLPGRYGKKASGFFNENIDTSRVVSPVVFQIKKVVSVIRNDLKIEKEFDLWVSHKINSGVFNPDVLISLQDFMPRTVESAWKKGITIWSDQILNSSESTQIRLNAHCDDYGIKKKLVGDKINTDILSIASVVTSPSQFVDDGLMGRINKEAKLFRVPYGVDFNIFREVKPYTPNKDVLKILVRGNSVRKGGHLVLRALSLGAKEYLKKSARKKIQVTFIGEISEELKDIYLSVQDIDSCSVTCGNISHVDLPSLFCDSDFMIMPTLAEGMSLIIPEALSCGLPVVSTKYCGVDYLVDGFNGVISEDSVVGIKDGIIKMIGMLENWKEIRNDCIRSTKNHGWGSYSKKIEDICHDLMKAKI